MRRTNKQLTRQTEDCYHTVEIQKCRKPNYSDINLFRVCYDDTLHFGLIEKNYHYKTAN